MTWWQIALLAYFMYWLGVNATVLERERYGVWMKNSWVMINQRLWWMRMLDRNPEDVRIEDITEMTENMLRSLHDYNDVFGRPYDKEDPLELDEEISDELIK
jgi:hypothetical protein